MPPEKVFRALGRSVSPPEKAFCTQSPASGAGIKTSFPMRPDLGLACHTSSSTTSIIGMWGRAPTSGQPSRAVACARAGHCRRRDPEPCPDTELVSWLHVVADIEGDEVRDRDADVGSDILNHHTALAHDVLLAPIGQLLVAWVITLRVRVSNQHHDHQLVSSDMLHYRPRGPASAASPASSAAPIGTRTGSRNVNILRFLLPAGGAFRSYFIEKQLTGAVPFLFPGIVFHPRPFRLPAEKLFRGGYSVLAFPFRSAAAVHRL